MNLVTKDELKQRIERRPNITYDKKLQQQIKSVNHGYLPRKLKHNGFDGGDYAETYMSARPPLR